MSFKSRGCVFLKLPLGYSARSADPFKPFISQPAGGPAVSGVVYHKGLTTVGGNLGLLSHLLNGFDAVKNAGPRRP